MRSIGLKLILISCLLYTGVMSAQTPEREAATPVLNFRDTLLMAIEGGKKVVFHPVKPKQTLFSIARYYSLSLEELYNYNPQFRNDPTLRTGTTVKIPLPNRAILRYKTANFRTWKYVPIYYVVQNGDNLYQICKRHFDMPVDSIIKRNRMRSEQIHPGQLILMGWMDKNGILPEWRPARPAAVSNTLRNQFNNEKQKLKEQDAQGVCFWQRDSKEKGDLYALHRDAAIGSVLAVTNPIYSRTVYAKVIGRIPEGYEHNIELILSPEAARKIGAKDPRFFVKIKYLKQT
ncbi:MAG: LysM peptidoglycan-binding domain-containing protein [Bacteroidetes bacterium]|nr:LysM peptidoglycan-binding domain-containing protein [Bacteroidota bacterium]